MAKQLQDNDIARLVSNVTQPILGTKAVVVSGAEDDPEHFMCLPLHGAPGFNVFMAMTSAGLLQLTSVMFGVESAAVDPSMMKDSLGELANMAAGQIKAAMEPGHVLGLPAAPNLPLELLRDARFVDLRAGTIPIRVYLVPLSN